MKILIVNNLFEPNIVGGAEVSVKHLAMMLLDRGVEVKILSLGLNGNSSFTEYASYKGLTSIWPIKSPRSFLQRLAFQFIGDVNPIHLSKQINRVFDEFNPDIVHTNNLAGIGQNIWGFAKNRNIKVVHTLRDYYQLCAKQTMYQDGTNCNGQCTECKFLCFRRSHQSANVDYVIGNSEFTLKAHLNAGYFPNAKTGVISGGLAEDFVLKGDRKNRNKIIIGYLGQILPSKGLEDFLLVSNFLPDFNFYIAGAGEQSYIDSLKEKHPQGNIHFMGRVVAKEFLDSISILVVTSKWNEPLPRVIYEAHSRGVSVVASRVGGNPEIMTGSQEKYLYNPGDIDSLFNLLSDLISKLRENKINFNELKLHSSRFLATSVSEKYLKIYEELINA